MIKFRQKDFSHYVVSDAIKGAAIGGLMGGGASDFINGALPAVPTFKSSDGKFTKHWNKGAGILNNKHTTKDGRSVYDNEANKRRTLSTTSGVIIGAALGALIGGVKDIYNKINEKRNLYGNMTNKVIRALKNKGYREDVDFTINPKVADRLKTRVCFVITKDGEGLRLMVNLKGDSRLISTAKKVTDKLNNSSISVNTKNASNVYNDILITTARSRAKSSDANLISELTANFINAEYPVYLVEVG